MKIWYAKQLSELANVSVRTLHHYDNIDLLKPSIRESNGYRLYSEKDLLRLQQIVALKFFGFELAQIRSMLSNQDEVLDNFTMQTDFLQKKANAMLEACEILQKITHEYASAKVIPWKKTIELIEVFQMTEQLEHSWVKEIYSQQELKEYAEFEANLKANSSSKDKAKFEQEWAAFIDELNSKLHLSPVSEEGVDLGKRMMAWVNKVFGKKYAHLRTKKMEKGFGEGKGFEDTGFTKESVAWIRQSTEAYWKQRIYGALEQVGTLNSKEVLVQWNEIMDDMYGEQESRKIELINNALVDEKVSNEAKQWLNELLNSALN